MRRIDTTGLTDKQIEFLIEQVRKDRAANLETQVEEQKEEKKVLVRHAKSDCMKYYRIRREIINVELRTAQVTVIRWATDPWAYQISGMTWVVLVLRAFGCLLPMCLYFFLHFISLHVLDRKY